MISLLSQLQSLNTTNNEELQQQQQQRGQQRGLQGGESNHRELPRPIATHSDKRIL